MQCKDKVKLNAKKQRRKENVKFCLASRFLYSSRLCFFAFNFILTFFFYITISVWRNYPLCAIVRSCNRRPKNSKNYVGTARAPYPWRQKTALIVASTPVPSPLMENRNPCFSPLIRSISVQAKIKNAPQRLSYSLQRP